MQVGTIAAFLYQTIPGNLRTVVTWSAIYMLNFLCHWLHASWKTYSNRGGKCIPAVLLFETIQSPFYSLSNEICCFLQCFVCMDWCSQPPPPPLTPPPFVNSEGQSRKKMSMNTSFEEKGEPSRTRTDILEELGRTGSHVVLFFHFFVLNCLSIYIYIYVCVYVYIPTDVVQSVLFVRLSQRRVVCEDLVEGSEIPGNRGEKEPRSLCPLLTARK